MMRRLTDELGASISLFRDNDLQLNVSKTKELIVEYKKEQGAGHSINWTLVDL